MAYQSGPREFELHLPWCPRDIRLDCRKTDLDGCICGIPLAFDAMLDRDLDGEADWPLLEVLRSDGDASYAFADYRYLERFLLRSGLGTNS
jgi:hypothetical protein